MSVESVVFGVASLVLGGSGIGTFLLLAYRSGKFVEKLGQIEKSINGPIQVQFDELKAGNERTQSAVEEMSLKWSERAEMCGRREDRETGGSFSQERRVERRESYHAIDFGTTADVEERDHE
jgi:hypothetical protein